MQATPYLAPGSGLGLAWGCPMGGPGPGMKMNQPPATGMAGQVEVSDELSSNLHYDAFHYAGQNTGQPWGWGAAYRHASGGGDSFGDWVVGGAWRAPSNRLSLGASWSHIDLTTVTKESLLVRDPATGISGSTSHDYDIFTGGLIYADPVNWTSVPLRWGAVVDVGSHFEPIWTVGAAVPFDKRGGVVADWEDVFNQYDSVLNLGAEYWLGAQYNWAVRVGIADLGGKSTGGSTFADGVTPAGTDPSTPDTVTEVGGSRWTAGASYLVQAWQFDLAWQQAKSGLDTSLKLSASYGF
jgi:hypothetical protein